MNLNSNRVVNITYCDVAIFRYLLDCFHYGYRNQSIISCPLVMKFVISLNL